MYNRKAILPHKEKIKKKLKMKSQESVSKFRHYTMSYSVKKQRAVNQSGDVTNTVIGLDDEYNTQLIETDS